MVKKKIKETLIEWKKFFRRNARILNSKRATQKGVVNLHWWSRADIDGKENVGDYLSCVVCEYMLSKRNLCMEWNVGKTKHLYAIGSIIQGGTQNAVIWGSGLKHGSSDFTWLVRKVRKLDIRLVRGPKTREALIQNGYDCPEVYGDPALIMPQIYRPIRMETSDYLVILHFKSKHNIPGAITPLVNDYKTFIDKIYNSKLVISSSLHGIILAEAYGVPSFLLIDDETENRFKYEDYYYSTGRNILPLVKDVNEALSKPVPKLPDLSKLQQNILNTFPYDLWY